MRREPRWPPHAFVVAAHAEQVREHGGKAGLRDEASLDSVLARNTWGSDTDVFLQLNGYAIDAPEPAVVDVITRLASGRLTREQLAE